MYLLHRLSTTYNKAMQVRYMLPQVCVLMSMRRRRGSGEKWRMGLREERFVPVAARERSSLQASWMVAPWQQDHQSWSEAQPRPMCASALSTADHPSLCP